MKVGSRLAHYSSDGKLDLDEQKQLRAEAKDLKHAGRTQEAKLIDAVVAGAPRGLERLIARFDNQPSLDARRALASAAETGLGWETHASGVDVHALVAKWAHEPPSMADALLALATLAPKDRGEVFVALAKTVSRADADVLLGALRKAPPEQIARAAVAMAENPALSVQHTIGQLLDQTGPKTGAQVMAALLDAHGTRSEVRSLTFRFADDALQQRAVSLAGGSLTELASALSGPWDQGRTFGAAASALIAARTSVSTGRAEADALARAVTRLPGTFRERAPLLEALAAKASPLALTQAVYDAGWASWSPPANEHKETRYAAEQLALVKGHVLPRATLEEKQQVLRLVVQRMDWSSVGPDVVKLLIADRSLPRADVQGVLHDYALPHWGHDVPALQRLLDTSWPK